MSKATTAKKTREIQRLEEALRARFPRSEAYRYNSASIRIRIIDERFRGISKADREEMVFPILETLPDKIQDDIMVLLLITEDELDRSLMNLEFENPTPSPLR